MTPNKTSFQLLAQAETLLIYGIFLFLTGLAQIAVTISHRFLIERTVEFSHWFPLRWTMNEIHRWYIYPSAALTCIPFLCSMIYALCKRQSLTIFICLSSLISFISSSVYVGLLIAHTLEYWQKISSDPSKALLLTSTVPNHLLVSFNEPANFANLALLITFTLALVQALLSMIGAVISCLWSPCCLTQSSSNSYTPIVNTNTHYVQTTPHHHQQQQQHRHDNPPLSQTTPTVGSSTLRSAPRTPQYADPHRYISVNGYMNKNSPFRAHYDDV